MGHLDQITLGLLGPVVRALDSGPNCPPVRTLGVPHFRVS